LKRIMSTLAGLGIFVFSIPPAALSADKPCVGRIILVGTTETPAWFIHDMLLVRTGDRFQYPLMRLGERNLGRCGRFVVDLQHNIRPTVRILKENDAGTVVDIVVTVQERPRNCVVPAGFDAVILRSGGQLYHCRYMAITLVEIISDALANWSDLDFLVTR
jgi:hypothetical protein